MRITEEEYAALTGKTPPKKKNKYNAKRTEYQGVTYDSKAEAKMARDLDYLKRSGEIEKVERQVPVQLGPDFKTRIDFKVYEPGKPPYGVEVKGYRKQKRWPETRRLWKKYGPFPLQVFTKGRLIETLEGKLF